jgi:RNA polymerase sigma-70 factor, ECF subfamily
MRKRVSKSASQELTFLAALERIHADVDISKIGEIQDWSRAVRGKFHGTSVKATLLSPDPMAILRRWHARDTRGSSTENVSGALLPMPSANTATYGNLQYSQMAIPQLIAVCKSESSEEAWSEFVRRFQPLITGVITKIVHRFGSVSSELVHDLSQEVYLRLCSENFRALKSIEFRHEAALLGLLKVIAVNTAMDHFRSAEFRRGGGKALESDLVSPESVPSPNASIEPEKRMFLEEIDRALKTLSHQPNFKRDYAIFWLYYRNGLTAKAISDLPDVKLTVKGVESILHRLARHIRGAFLKDKKGS